MVQPTSKRGKDPLAENNTTPTKRRKVGSSPPPPDVRSSPASSSSSNSKRQTRSNSGNLLNSGDPSSNLIAAESHKRRGRPKSVHTTPVADSPAHTTSAAAHHTSTQDSGVGDECSPAIAALRQPAIQKRLDLVRKLVVQKEKELMELLFLESGGNLVDFDVKSPVMKDMVNNYNATHGSVFMLDEPVKKTPRITVKPPVAPPLVEPIALSTTAHPATPATPVPTTPATPSTPAPPTEVSTTELTVPKVKDIAVPTTPATPVTPAAPATPATFATPATPAARTTFPSIFALPASITDADKERAAKDAAAIRRVGELQRAGLWSLKRIPKAPEPARTKVHWDFLLDEMEWLANDFREERKWKMALAKKISKGVLKYHQLLATKEERKVKEEELQIRKLAATVSREIKKFWQKIEKLVLFKHQARIDEKKKEVMDKHLDFLVGQTERYSFMLAQDLNRSTDSVAQTTTSSTAASTEEAVKAEPMDVDKSEAVKSESEEEEPIEREPSFTKELLSEETANDTADMAEDAEFVPSVEDAEDDDEATLEEEEKKVDVDMPTGDDEIARLQKESELPIHEVLQTFEQGEDQEADEDVDSDDDRTGGERINDAAASANEAQPKGFTLSTTSVKTKVPFLLRGTLREYQHIGLDWLVTMYDKRLNGILADEMGLGKTIQTISLLAHLACERGIWGPHLIVVPTSVMLNWELEFKKWCPAFKILTYYGSQKERKQKRQGWSKTNSFHVCITSYKVVMQDQIAFRRKKWKYFILDEAHNIKNFKSQRWQVLLNFNSKRRLLLTGTPLQNNLMELWSLMHFLMPHIFQSHKEFKDWFSNPVNNMIEGAESLNEDLISRLHAVLRPFILRRLKKDVEKQMPNKYHHVVSCQLSKRQRFLYEEFMASAGTQDTLKSGNFLGIVNVLMQLRKVCNHPDLFEVRPIVSPFDMEEIVFNTSSAVCRALEKDPFSSVDLSFLTNFCELEQLSTVSADRISQLQARPPKIIELSSTYTDSNTHTSSSSSSSTTTTSTYGLEQFRTAREERTSQQRLATLTHLARLNELRCNQRPIYGDNLHRLVQIHSSEPSLKPEPPSNVHLLEADPRRFGSYPNSLAEIVKLPAKRAEEMLPITENFVCIIPKARAKPISIHSSHPNPSTVREQQRNTQELVQEVLPTVDIFRPSFVRTQMYFPDKRLVQYDCGKLQQLDLLLRTLKAGGHRALIFTQMTRMLDVLEVFLNIHGHTYLRLDGSTKIEKRQQLTERFNADPKVFVFILSTRSGGLGINLTGADTVIFYDSDWNPAMDAQAQDRCHRIGQTRDVHIYRLITEYTIEENILKKANQKRHLDDVIIKGGGFTTDFFKSTDIRDIFNSTKDQIELESAPVQFSKTSTGAIVDEPKFNMTQQEWEAAVANAEDESDVLALRQAQKEQAEEGHEFEEDTTAQEDGTVQAASEAAGESKDLYEFQVDDNKSALSQSQSQFAFEDELLPIQRYALHFLEVVNPVIAPESVEAMANEVEFKQQEWELENLKRLKEEEEERMSEDDEVLFYEVEEGS